MNQRPHELTEEEFLSWLEHPVTQEVLRYCNSRRFELMNQWAEGHFTSPNDVGTSLLNAEAVGKAQTYGEMLALDFEQLKEGLKE